MYGPGVAANCGLESRPWIPPGGFAQWRVWSTGSRCGRYADAGSAGSSRSSLIHVTWTGRFHAASIVSDGALWTRRPRLLAEATAPYPQTVVIGSPTGRICCSNWRTEIRYWSRGLPPAAGRVPARGMTGGMSSGVTYFGIAVGSSVVPSSGTARTTRRPSTNVVRNRAVPAQAEPARNWRRVSFISRSPLEPPAGLARGRHARQPRSRASDSGAPPRALIRGLRRAGRPATAPGLVRSAGGTRTGYCWTAPCGRRNGPGPVCRAQPAWSVSRTDPGARCASRPVRRRTSSRSATVPGSAGTPGARTAASAIAPRRW